MKTWIVTIALCIGIVLMPSDAKPQEKPPNPIFGCVVVIIGGIIIYGIYKLCKKIPDPKPPAEDDPPAPPPTNAPPVFNPPPTVNQFTPQVFQALREIPSYSVSILDSYSGGTFTSKWAFTIQASTDLQSWHEAMRVTVWESDSGGAFYACSRNGTNQNFYFTHQTGTNSLPVDFSDGKAEKEFFRIVAP
jgi:hypothetical protein